MHPRRTQAQSVVARLDRRTRGISNDDLPAGVAVELWDGSQINVGSENPVSTLKVNTPAGLRALLFRRDSLSLGEAYIYKDIEVPGNLQEIFPVVDRLVDRRPGLPEIVKAAQLLFQSRPSAGRDHAVRLAGPRFSRNRTRKAIRYHYDLPVEFWQLWLDPRLVYSCAYFETPADSLEEAQKAKLDLICRKLRLEPNERFLDMGCGWGALICHAAKYYGVKAVGVTLARRQAEYAARQIDQLGLGERCTVQVRNFLDLKDQEPFDKIASVGAVEHVQSLQRYFGAAAGLLKPGGWFLNHGITSSPTAPLRKGRSFLDRYVFPDYRLASIGETVRAAEQAGFDVRDVENLREHYEQTLGLWHRRLVARRTSIEEITDPVRYRIFDLYLAGTAYEFRVGRLHLHQTLLCKVEKETRLPLRTRRDWYDR